MAGVAQASCQESYVCELVARRDDFLLLAAVYRGSVQTGSHSSRTGETSPRQKEPGLLLLWTGDPSAASGRSAASTYPPLLGSPTVSSHLLDLRLLLLPPRGE